MRKGERVNSLTEVLSYVGALPRRGRWYVVMLGATEIEVIRNLEDPDVGRRLHQGGRANAL
jgi:hypothetical protein